MSVVLSMETFNKLEEKFGNETAKQIYELAEAIYEEVSGKAEEKLSKYRLDFADDEYKRLTRKELDAFKQELFEQQKNNKELFALQIKETVKPLLTTMRITVSLLVINLIVIIALAYQILFQ